MICDSDLKKGWGHIYKVREFTKCKQFIISSVHYAGMRVGLLIIIVQKKYHATSLLINRHILSLKSSKLASRRDLTLT